jgi:hypothetical protein
VDVLQVRAPIGTVIGAFQLMIPVSRAARLYARQVRLLRVFEERLAMASVESRWHPILRAQVDYFRSRALGLAEEAADECRQEPNGNQGDEPR